jgi:hypothetical protein
MRTAPPIAPHEPGQDTYLVLDDFGRLGNGLKHQKEMRSMDQGAGS